MTDIYLAIAVSGILSVGFCALGAWLGKRLPKWAVVLGVAALVGFLFLHAYVLADNLLIAKFLPLAGVMVLGNFSMEAVGMMVGLAWRLVPGGPWRKGMLLMPMATICAWKVCSPAFQQVPVMFADRWDHGVCMQTSKFSCSAAAAATLLKMHGIDTTEQEMATLCRTSRQGTPMLGLYRGLKLKTRGTTWDVKVLRGSVDDLRQVKGPVLVSVGLKRDEVADPRYTHEWGWEPGVKHTVVALDFDAKNEVEIADPNVGREHWGVQDLETLWWGEGVRLALRQ